MAFIILGKMMKTGEHEIYRKRGKKNIGLGIIMGLFVLLIFFVTIVKMTDGNSMQAFDHSLRPELTERENNIE